jgi:hypothetical protein
MEFRLDWPEVQAMPAPEMTTRQEIVQFLMGRFCSSRDLAESIGISERQVEDHLTHIIRSLARDRHRRFVLEPAACRSCDYVFRGRTHLTRPSRCPKCRSEGIAPPRFGIEASQP